MAPPRGRPRRAPPRPGAGPPPRGARAGAGLPPRSRPTRGAAAAGRDGQQALDPEGQADAPEAVQPVRARRHGQAAHLTGEARPGVHPRVEPVVAAATADIGVGVGGPPAARRTARCSRRCPGWRPAPHPPGRRAGSRGPRGSRTGRPAPRGRRRWRRSAPGGCRLGPRSGPPGTAAGRRGRGDAVVAPGAAQPGRVGGRQRVPQGGILWGDRGVAQEGPARALRGRGPAPQLRQPRGQVGGPDRLRTAGLPPQANRPVEADRDRRPCAQRDLHSARTAAR